jgi:hypothetical protein
MGMERYKNPSVVGSCFKCGVKLPNCLLGKRKGDRYGALYCVDCIGGSGK